ncbi:hypothetical protein JCM8097_001106 [Rhodosporidiobolus ruineniae]
MSTTAEPDFAAPASASLANWIRSPPTAGNIVALVLYGIYVVLHVQYVGSSYYARLGRGMKAGVWVVAVLLTGFVVLVALDTVYWTITMDRSLSHLLWGSSYEAAMPAVGGTVAAIVQTILALRAALMFRRDTVRYVFLGVVSCGILFTFVSAVLTTVALFRGLLYFETKLGRLNINQYFSLWLWGMACADSAISIALASALQTAAYTTVFAIVGATLGVSYELTAADLKYSWLPFIFSPVLPTCYGLSLYTTLSTRRLIDERLSAGVGVGGPAGRRSLQKDSVATGGGAKGEAAVPAAYALRPMLPRENSYGGVEVTKSVEVEVEMGEEEEELGRRRGV